MRKRKNKLIETQLVGEERMEIIVPGLSPNDSADLNAGNHRHTKPVVIMTDDFWPKGRKIKRNFS